MKTSHSDSDRVEFTVPGVPIAKARARTTKHGSYTPKHTKRYEKLVQGYALDAMNGRRKLHGALRMTVCIYMPIPESWPRWRKQEARLENVWHTVKPDASNIIKSIEDACNNIVYRDDSAVASHTDHQRYSDNPRAVVIFNELGGINSHSLASERQ